MSGTGLGGPPRAVCVFCGARPGRDPRLLAVARRTGTLLAESGATLVYGGGRVGMMGALADAALAAAGRVVGIIPEVLMAREVAHSAVSELLVVADMHERKRQMIERADAFLTLPGGLGTLDELFEVLTLRQLGQHHKPALLVNDQGYFDALLHGLQSWVAQGLVDGRDLAALECVATPDAALQRLGLTPGGAPAPVRAL